MALIDKFEFASEAQEQAFRFGPAPLLMSGGYGCIGPDTRIFNAETNTHEKVIDLVSQQRAPVVLAWDGAKYVSIRASIPFKRGQERLYKVTTSRGKSLVVTGRHRFLRPQGWYCLDDSFSGASVLLLGCGPSHLPSSWEPFQLAHVLNDPHSIERVLNSHRDCPTCPRSYGELLREAQGIDQDVSSLRDDALEYTLADFHEFPERMGVLQGQLLEYNHLHQSFDRLSSLHSYPQTLPHVALALRQDFAEHDGLVHSAQANLVNSLFQSNRGQGLQVFLSQSDTALESNVLDKASQAYPEYIISVEDMGVGDYYDLTVPVYHNYLAEGLIHHNSGKTVIALMKLLYLSDRYPNSRFAIVRRRATDLRKTTLATLWKLLPPDAYVRRNDTLGELELRNGSKFFYFHLDREGIATTVRGLELNSAYMDEATEIDSNLVDLLESRTNRWDKAKVNEDEVKAYEAVNHVEWPWKTPSGIILPPSFFMLSCNPDTQLHWLWKRFHPDSPEWREKWRDKGYRLIHFNSRDNKFLSKKNLELLLSRGKDFVRQYVDGIWGRPEGSIFTIDPSSILDPEPSLLEKIKNECVLFRALDHGFSAPTSCLWLAADRQLNIYVFKEYYQRSDSIRVHRHSITEMSKDESYTTSVADTEIFNMMPAPKGGRWSVAGEYLDTRLYPKETAIHWARADKNEMASRSRLIEYLAIDPNHIHPITKQKGAPHLYFIQKTEGYKHGCNEVIKETGAQQLLKVGESDGQPIFSDERDPDIVDHAFDALRYGVMTRPILPSARKQSLSKQTFSGYAKMSKEINRRNRANDDKDR